MSITYVHLSDIHFGQEKGADLIIHDDVKERLIEDAEEQVRIHAGSPAKGLIVTGDVAYGGKPFEYENAGKWLERLTAAVGCRKTAVKLVPGNHDIDRDRISAGCKFLLDEIVRDGEPKLDKFLANDDDRKSLYHRFAAYEPFALGYDCPLDSSGGIASPRLTLHRAIATPRAFQGTAAMCFRFRRSRAAPGVSPTNLKRPACVAQYRQQRRQGTTVLGSVAKGQAAATDPPNGVLTATPTGEPRKVGSRGRSGQPKEEPGSTPPASAS